ncbi:MAG: EAL domain-containing protein [Solirubrobacteraceae bacterium]
MISHHLTARRFAGATVLACVGVLVALHARLGLGYVSSHPLAFALLALGVLLGELLPVTIPRRGDEQITVSTSFSMAVLVLGGLGPALVALLLASLVQDLAVRKSWWRIRFNFGQYGLSLAAASLVIAAFHRIPEVTGGRPFSGADVPIILLGAAAFVAVNAGVVGTAVALYQGTPLGRYFRKDAEFTLVSGGVLLCLAPIVAAAAAYSIVLIPLFVLPIMAIYRAGRQAARSEHAARHDQLTGLPNRIAFHDTVNEVLEDGNRLASVLLMDLNRFKDVNDTLGHRYGDELLRRIAERLQASVGSEHALARLGGDEFAVFIQISGEDALEFARRVGEELRTSFELGDFVVETEASVGVASFPEDGRDLETLLQKADVAMYRAKETHAGVAAYDERHDHNSPAKLALTADLRQAVDTDQIVAWYQPLLDLNSGRVAGVEALVSWQHPDLGVLLPASFLDMAEHTSLIKPLTQKVLDLAMAQIVQWRDLGLEVSVAVNVSTRMLIDPGFAERVRTALVAYEIPPRLLRLEVTESALMADPVVARAALTELDRNGVAISIDDFGTGYSSLAYLADLPVSEVKIDRGFVSRMQVGSSEAVIVRSTIDLGHHLGLRVVAEGVEEPETLEQLRDLGCDVAQGYGISRPMTAEDTTQWLLRACAPAGDGRAPVVSIVEAA